MAKIPRRQAPVDEPELLLRANALAGRSVHALALALSIELPTEPKRAKGFIGQLVELALGADPDAGERPDFVALGIELKTIPIGPHGNPSESTFCCSVSLDGADQERWENSRLRQRLRRVLFVPVDGAHVPEIHARRFHRPVIWSPTLAQDAMLQDDWTQLIGRVGADLPVSAHLGDVLQLRPKAANSRVRFTTMGKARSPLAFYLRTKFTGALLSGDTG